MDKIKDLKSWIIYDDKFLYYYYQWDLNKIIYNFDFNSLNWFFENHELYLKDKNWKYKLDKFFKKVEKLKKD